jgi:hypothetical protein
VVLGRRPTKHHIPSLPRGQSPCSLFMESHFAFPRLLVPVRRFDAVARCQDVPKGNIGPSQANGFRSSPWASRRRRDLLELLDRR